MRLKYIINNDMHFVGYLYIVVVVKLFFIYLFALFSESSFHKKTVWWCDCGRNHDPDICTCLRDECRWIELSNEQLLLLPIICFLFQLADNGPYLLETLYSAMLYTFISLHLKQQHSVAVFLSAVTVDLLCHQTIDSSNEHITADKQQVILYTLFIMTCQKDFEHAHIYVMFVQCAAPHKLCELHGDADFCPSLWK